MREQEETPQITVKNKGNRSSSVVTDLMWSCIIVAQVKKWRVKDASKVLQKSSSHFL